jgi:hypothetical protein
MSVPPFIIAWKARIARRDAVADNRIWLDVAFADADEAKTERLAGGWKHTSATALAPQAINRYHI